MAKQKKRKYTKRSPKWAANVAKVESGLPLSVSAEGLVQVFDEAQKLALRKSADYNTGVRLESYFPFGLRSYAHEIHKKANRLVSLLRTGKKPTNESIRDTLLDIINYSGYAIQGIDQGSAT